MHTEIKPMIIDSSEIIIRHHGKDTPLSKIMDKIQDFDKAKLIDEVLEMIPGYDDEIKKLGKQARDVELSAGDLESRIRNLEMIGGIYR
jgi:hypothetical protein